MLVCCVLALLAVVFLRLIPRLRSAKSVATHPMFPAVILAGGLSRRMGQDKAALVLAGTPLALRIARRLRPQASEVRLNAPTGHPLSNTLPIVSDTRVDRPGPSPAS